MIVYTEFNQVRKKIIHENNDFIYEGTNKLFKPVLIIEEFFIHTHL